MVHTELPWHYGKATNYEGFYIAPLGTLPTLGAVRTVGGNVDITCFNFPGEAEANAEFIVRAVNNFYPMLSALKNALYAGNGQISFIEIAEAIKEAEK